ncbi:MAG: hypothetical protein HY852_20650 [Bradyrhizobium sp.]|uniref:hypothetical protein n=1 Tax=Bradyrhizobium sp. TaxID=376 RepID=UPI0025C61118|nr:hypothetical protein [Bradyrhizobium sp.]MBI5264219.1 hypothetical protein [Bradyrhizobium sp.]
MKRALRFPITLIVLCSSALPLSAAQDTALERGTAITDSSVLRKLDQEDSFTLHRILWPERNANFPLATKLLFGWLPQLAPIRPALEAEFDRYIERHNAKFPNETIGVGEAFDVRLFDRRLLDSLETRFVLAGIVNRMDRAYVSDGSCGEIRLIYRLTRFEGADSDKAVSPLPMTLNLVLKARHENDRYHTRHENDRYVTHEPVTCAEIARRWLENSDWRDLLWRTSYPRDAMLDRIETNIQIAHAPKSAVRDFRTDYLLKAFKYNPDTHVFEESVLENQIDRDRILADDSLKREFRDWLLDPPHFGEFDRGTVLIPEKYLAKAAIAPTPAGLELSELQPEFGLVQGEGGAAPVFTEDDVASALKNAAERGIEMQNIRSLAGFARRLNDITCAGCHQTRAIGGFHFPGGDRTAASDSASVPASPHFFGDQVRRRDIMTAFRDGRAPDFSRGFAGRPQTRGSTELAGTQYQDGWGATCSLRPRGSKDDDRSFSSWNCAEGLSCQAVGTSSRIGMCFVDDR